MDYQQDEARVPNVDFNKYVPQQQPVYNQQQMPDSYYQQLMMLQAQQYAPQPPSPQPMPVPTATPRKNVITFENPFGNINMNELMKRILKYLILVLVTCAVVYYMSECKMDYMHIVKMGTVVAIVYAVLDTYAPSVMIKIE